MVDQIAAQKEAQMRSDLSQPPTEEQFQASLEEPRRPEHATKTVLYTLGGRPRALHAAVAVEILKGQAERPRSPEQMLYESAAAAKAATTPSAPISTSDLTGFGAKLEADAVAGELEGQNGPPADGAASDDALICKVPGCDLAEDGGPFVAKSLSGLGRHKTTRHKV